MPIKKIALGFLLFLGVLFDSCTPHISNDEAIQGIVQQFDPNGVFALYDYSVPRFKIGNLKKFEENRFHLETLAPLYASLLLVEQGLVFDEKKPIQFSSQQTLSMHNALTNQDTTFFSTLINSIRPDEFKRLVTQSKLNIDTQWTGTNYDKMTHTKSSYDELLGTMSKIYFQKFNFQPRTYKIVLKTYLPHRVDLDSANQLNIYKITLFHPVHYKISLGWFKIQERPYFFLLQMNAPDDKIDKTIKNILNYLKGEFNI